MSEEIKKERKKRSRAAISRNKGHSAERLYMNLFKDMGFDKCVTSRYGSHLSDDAKIDLMFIPVNAQIKAGYAKGLNYSQVLQEMSEAIKKTFPENTLEYNNPNILIHHKDVGGGKTRTEFHSLVTMTFETFTGLLNKIYPQK